MNKILLISIFLLAAVLRLWNLQNVPPHPSLDEATIGYNAYSLLQTGADEYGYKFPILLRAYDDFRPALYTYLVIPFVKIFGFNVFAVRLPSALLSVATVIAIFYLSKKLLTKETYKLGSLTISAPILITILFAISPWNIYISRLGHEANAFFSFFIFSVVFFFHFLDSKKYRWLTLSTTFFALSFTAYQNGKIFIPIIVISLVILYFKDLVRNKALLSSNAILGVVLVLPIVIASFGPDALIRFHATNLFSDTSSLEARSAQNSILDRQNNNYLGLILDNRRLIYPRLFLTSYSSHFDPFWLSTNGGDDQFKIPGLGLMYVYEIPLVLIGLLVLLRSKKIKGKIKIFLMVWLFSSVLPAAITNGYPHAMRAFQLMPVFSILSGFGLYSGIYYFKSMRVRSFLTVIELIVLTISAIVFFKQYFTVFPVNTAYQFQYGIKDAMSFVSMNEKDYDKIYISNKENLFESYMFYLFFTKYDPLKYQREGGTISGGYDKEHNIGKYNFGILSQHDLKGSVVISNPNEITGGRRIRTIYYPTGKEAIWITKL